MAKQSKYWCFTLNNPDVVLMPNGEYSCTAMDAVAASDDFKYLIWQLERGEECKTLHIQGYLELKSNKRLTGVKKIFNPHNPHLEQRRGTQEEAIAYCSKEESRVSGPFELGERTVGSQGKRSDLIQAIELMGSGGIQRVVDQMPHVYVRNYRGLHKLLEMQLKQREPGKCPEVVLMYGPPGCGKTRVFYDNSGNEGCAISCASGFWFDGYCGQKYALLDDFDGKASKWTLLQALQVLDRYVIKVPTKGGFVIWNPDVIFVTTNLHPRLWFEWENREKQWPALMRRFTHVTAWGDDGERHEFPRPDTVDEMQCDDARARWDKFWNYPTAFLYGSGPYSYY